jgi:GTP cyclohydrolase II
LRALVDAGIDVVERIPCEIPPNPHTLAYLRIKKRKMDHIYAAVADLVNL